MGDDRKSWMRSWKPTFLVRKTRKDRLVTENLTTGHFTFLTRLMTNTLPWSSKTLVRTLIFFFTALRAQSLQLSEKVLAKREKFHMQIDGLQFAIDIHLMKMEELRNIEAVISRHSDQVDANKNFEVKVMVAKKLKVPVDIKAAMNCRKCEITCHYPCDPFWAKECCEAFSTRGFWGFFCL